METKTLPTRPIQHVTHITDDSSYFTYLPNYIYAMNLCFMFNL